MATETPTRIWSERTNGRLILVAVLIACFGLLLMYIAGLSDFSQFWKDHADLQRILKDIGSLLFASVALTVLWELYGKRSFRDELLANFKGAQQVNSSGIVNYWNEADFHEGPWKELFHNAKEVDIVFHYGSTWRSVQQENLRTLAAKSGVRLRVVLPNYENPVLLSDMALRFDKTEAEVRSKVAEAESFFKGLKKEAGTKGADINIWLCDYPFSYSYYRFDHSAVMCLYRNLPFKSAPPTFIVEEGGDLFNFAHKEVERLTSDASPETRCVTKTNANTSPQPKSQP